ncbi:MAG TPA: glyoxalase, partial [Tahibacter sp.]|nr:glyoxalase [Tahibacter sp.]
MTSLPTNRSMPAASVIPELPYRDVRDAARWLARAFGFAERLRIGDHRVQLVVGDGAIVAVEAHGEPSPQRVMVRVADVDAHCAHARAAGAR